MVGCRHGKQSEWQDGRRQQGRAGKYSLIVYMWRVVHLWSLYKRLSRFSPYSMDSLNTNTFTVAQRIDLTDLFGALVDTPKFSFTLQ